MKNKEPIDNYDKGIRDTILFLLGVVFYILSCLIFYQHGNNEFLIVVTYMIIPLFAIILLFNF